MIPFDKRLTPARGDIAAAHLEGQVEAARFVEGQVWQVRAPVASIRRAAAPDAPLETHFHKARVRFHLGYLFHNA